MQRNDGRYRNSWNSGGLRGTWRGLVVSASALLIGGLLTGAPAEAATCTGKCFAATISPSIVYVGVSATQVQFSVVLSNESSNQLLGSANITAPAGITPVSATPPTVGTSAVVGNAIQLRNVAVQPGNSSTFSFVANVPAPTGSSSVTYTWQAQAKQSNDFNGSGNDFTLDPGTSHLTTTVSPTPRADLAVAFGSGSTPGDQPDPVTPSNDVLYTVRVTNNGPNPESSVRVVNAVTGGGSIGQAPAASSDPGWTCTQNDATSVTCSAGALAAGASKVLQIWVHAPATAPPAPIVCGANQVTGICDTADASGSQPDPVSSNNRATESTTVSPSAPCPPSDVSCARSFLNYAQDSTITTGSAANTTKWLVGTAFFPATSYSGGQVYNMDAPATPGVYCPLTAGGSVSTLTACTFEMDIDQVPTQYTGKNVTLTLECDSSHCNPATASFTLVKVADGQSSPQLLTRCDSAAPTTPCYTTGVSATDGNFQVHISNIPPGDPRFAGKCYDGCTPTVL